MRKQHSNTKELPLKDTLSVLSLRNKQYTSLNYKVLKVCDLDNEGYHIKSTCRIELTQQHKTIASIKLPVADVEVRNFSVSKIEEINSGFKIVVDWGGGNYFFEREFYFTFKDKRFYLTTLKLTNYIHEPEKTTKRTQQLNPPINIEKFDIIKYL
ncbi:hypothetical protein [Emticicia fluvialis]|uniref:hypothetical protein n=1 Tax=Emticicia fluvialis TaxID=2974474 RepID=UPI0021654499|nr:hypothetical protein [Emticicia fluvialis]